MDREKMTESHLRAVRITVEIEARTNLDDADLERRLENFIDPFDLGAQLLGDEAIEFESTTFRFSAGETEGGG